MEKKLKVTVVGPIPRDHITTASNESYTRYGCTTNSVIALSKLFGEEITIYPVAHIRKNDTQEIAEILKPYANISQEYISSEADQGDVFDLLYLNDVDKLARQTGYMNPFRPEEFKDLLDSDLFIITTCTDFELPLETLRYIKENSKGKIIFSAHGPTSTVNINGERNARFWVDRDLWLPYVDIIMMNLKEARGCWFKNEFATDELDTDREFTPGEVQPMAEHLLKVGVEAVFITTLDNLAGIVYYKTNGDLHANRFSVDVEQEVLETTGCAEAFSAGVAYGLLKGKNAADTSWYAAKLAAQRICNLELDAFISGDALEKELDIEVHS